MKTIYDGEYFEIISYGKFDKIKEDLISYLNSKVKEIVLFFNINNLVKFNIYLYSDKDMFKKATKYPYKLDKLAGTFYLYGVKIYADLDNISKKEFFAATAHEIIHLLYLKYVSEKGLKNRTIWFEEGISQNLSGEKDYLNDDNEFSTYLIKNIYNEDKVLPNIDYLCRHGNKFGEFKDEDTNKYNGYVWSYLMVKYLLTIIPKEYFDKIMRSKLEIDIIGRRIIDSTYNYYKRKIRVKN